MERRDAVAHVRIQVQVLYLGSFKVRPLSQERMAKGRSLPFVGENRGCLLSIFTTHFTTFAPSKHHASHQDFRKILAKAPKIHQPGASNFLVKFTTICRSKMRSYESVFCCWVADY